ncbi:TPT-domain-containing protein [Rhizodiscina lignyota]|uniref:TPT-domain-containing protein n=1 Tax=Rhizodiscina lignyota TaxID=1504668 RepID=A0A9P4MBQ0_9PEZI|nr:TPT-domain-containing protein [Rhizodiscina lignyota]
MTSSDDLEMDPLYEDDINDDEEAGLTSAERAKMKKQKRRRTRLDERIAGTAPGAYDVTQQEERVATRYMVKNLLINGTLIGGWYFFSISISVYNKWMFKDEKTPKEGEDGPEQSPPVFPFPLFTTCAHMIVQFSLAALVMWIFPKFRPRHGAVNPHHAESIRRTEEPVDEKKPLMTRWFYLTRIAPCGLATGMDIGLGNMSLKFITLTFYTMCKSSVLGFVLVFAFIFRLEKPTWKLCGIITVMTIGVIMMVAGETSFNVLGFVLVMSAAASSGFRWSLTQILLLRNPATSNPFASIFFLAPVMFFALLIIAIPVEGPVALGRGLAHLVELKGAALTPFILIFPGCLAFLMTASEFALLQRTSVVTLSICGIFKEVITISTASIVFADKLTPVNVSGVLVTIACIVAYNYMKFKKMRDDARMEAHLQGSASRIIRNSLSIAISSPSDARDGQSTQSPVKRPENLE